MPRTCASSLLFNNYSCPPAAACNSDWTVVKHVHPERSADSHQNKQTSLLSYFRVQTRGAHTHTHTHTHTQEQWHLISTQKERKRRRKKKREGVGGEEEREREGLAPYIPPSQTSPPPIDLLPPRMLKNTHQPPLTHPLSFPPICLFNHHRYTRSQCLVWQQHNIQVKTNTQESTLRGGETVDLTEECVQREKIFWKTKVRLR